MRSRFHSFDEQIGHWLRNSSVISLKIYYVMWEYAAIDVTRVENMPNETNEREKNHDKSVPNSLSDQTVYEFVSEKRKFNIDVLMLVVRVVTGGMIIIKTT